MVVICQLSAISHQLSAKADQRTAIWGGKQQAAEVEWLPALYRSWLTADR